MTDAKIDLELAEIHTISFGRGKSLVLLPGFPFPASIFLLLEPYLAPNFAVTALDLPGWMGKSKFKTPDKKGVSDYVNILKELLDKIYPDQKINLCGVSAGGTLALLLAYSYPEKIDKIIVQSSPYCGRTVENRFKKLYYMAKIANNYPISAFLIKRLYKYILYVQLHGIINRIALNQIEKEVKISFQNLDLHSAQFGIEYLKSDFTQYFKKIIHETVVIGCGKDDIVPASLMKTLAFEILPKAKYIDSHG